MKPAPILVTAALVLVACSDDSPARPAGDGGTSSGDARVTASCQPAAGGGSTEVGQPNLSLTLKDRWHEGWLASPAVVDLDGDGKKEIVAPRDNRLVVWNTDGSKRFHKDLDGRIFASPVVGQLVPGGGLEIAVASRGEIHAWDAGGEVLAGFPVTFRDEMRAIAAGDIDGDDRLELVAVTTNALSGNGQDDIVIAVKGDGSVAAGFPPNTTGVGGCDENCWVTGGYNQNLAVGDVDGDGTDDILAPQDNAYISFHHGDGRLFDAASIFDGRSKWPGIRFLLTYSDARRGWPDDDEAANQAHFTDSAPAIADVDGDGRRELVVLGSVQNAAQTDRERGVALWLLHSDGTRLAGWESPFHAPDYLAGLWDFEEDNVAAAGNQVSVVDLDASRAGLEMIFAGYDGWIYAVGADRQQLWRYRYTDDPRVLTSGVVIADLSGDGAAEIVFASYSPDPGKSHLFILDAAGNERHKVALPERGAMAVPTIADLQGDGPLEIFVSMKDSEEEQRLVAVYTVPGSAPNCLLWPTGRRDLLRSGLVP